MSKCVICKSHVKENEEFCEDCQTSVRIALEDLFYGFIESFDAPEIKVNKLIRNVFLKWDAEEVDSILDTVMADKENEEDG